MSNGIHQYSRKLPCVISSPELVRPLIHENLLATRCVVGSEHLRNSSFFLGSTSGKFCKHHLWFLRWNLLRNKTTSCAKHVSREELVRLLTGERKQFARNVVSNVLNSDAKFDRGLVHFQSEEIHSTCDLFPIEQETTSGHCSHDAFRAASLPQCVQLFVHTTETNTLLIFWRPSQPAAVVGNFCWLLLQLGGLQVSCVLHLPSCMPVCVSFVCQCSGWRPPGCCFFFPTALLHGLAVALSQRVNCL